MRVWSPKEGFLDLWRLAAVACLFFAAVAIVPMWHLWCNREYKMYGGKTVEEQRPVLFERIGMDQYLLRDACLIRSSLPGYYKIIGDGIRLSYVQYLLIPSIPDQNSDAVITDTGSALAFENHGSMSDQERPLLNDKGSSPWALLRPLFLIFGMAVGLLCVWPALGAVPPAFMMSCFLVMVLSVFSRGVLGTAEPGFRAAAWLGVFGWGGFLYRSINRKSFALRGVVPGLLQRNYLRGSKFYLLLLICCAYLVWSLVMAVIVVPDDWDAWAMWGAKAKVLALGSGPLSDVTRFGTADYPLMWPALWAFSGWCVGGWEEVWAKGWGAVLLGLAAWELARNRGGLVGALFVCMPGIALFASWAYAEPLFWLVLVCVCSTIKRLAVTPGTGSGVLVGMSMSALMYTKNEGIVLWLLASGWLIINAKDFRLRDLSLAIILPILIYAPWFVWTRLMLHLQTHTTGGVLETSDMASRIVGYFAPSLSAVLIVMGNIRLWGLTGFAVFVIWLWRLLLGDRRQKTVALGLLVLFGTYFAVILAGRNDPLWQIGVAWNRLVVHMIIPVMFWLVPGHSSEKGSNRL